MNVNLLTRLNPTSVRNNWRWIPEITYRGWKLKKGGHVWYLTLAWLNSQIDVDNDVQ